MTNFEGLSFKVMYCRCSALKAAPLQKLSRQKLSLSSASSSARGNWPNFRETADAMSLLLFPAPNFICCKMAGTVSYSLGHSSCSPLHSMTSSRSPTQSKPSWLSSTMHSLVLRLLPLGPQVTEQVVQAVQGCHSVGEIIVNSL